MDGSRFDALVRSLYTSHFRRDLSRVFGFFALGGSLALLQQSEASAKRKKGKKRKKRKKRKEQQGDCGLLPPDATCCDATSNTCHQPGGCICPTGRECLSNGSCAIACEDVLDCPLLCTCSLPSTEGPRRCVIPVSSSAAVPQPCTSTADCLPGQHCSPLGCGQGGPLENRCRPLC